jgi:hypothetical protein
MAKRTAKPAARKPKGKDRPKAPSRPATSRAVRPERKPAEAAAGTVYPVKITLAHIQPPVWRRVLLKDCTLAELHDVIQISMGWEDCHLHDFEIGKQQFGDPSQWGGPDPWGEEVGDEGEVKLSRLFGQGVKKLRYVYDMGDNWEHTIQLEKTKAPEPGVRYPRCVAGARACPPEDCGGPWGYADFVDAVQNPKNPQHEDMVEWVGGDFDPEEFDPQAVNEALSGVR